MNLLFDLDGTLTDPKVGITRSMNYALVKFGLPPREPSTIERLIGASLQESFHELVGVDDRETLMQGVARYRERYFAEGWLENTVYDGVPDLLNACRASGHRLYVATSKRKDIAQRILEHFELAPYFTAIYGGDVGLSKAEILDRLLMEQRLSPTDCMMIGDREQDVSAGRANGVSTVGVLWGYGSKDELVEAGADHLAESPSELLSLLCG